MFENPIRKNDEHWKDNLIGQTLNKRLEQAIQEKHMLETQLTRLELQKDRIERKIKNSRVELLPNIYEGTLVAALQSKTKKILDIAFNTPEDLILDNFGKWLAAIYMTPPPNGNPTVYSQATLKDTTNASRNIYLYAQPYSYGLFNGPTSTNYASAGTQLQVGSGATPAARNNYAIQTVFGTSPENARFSTSPGSYASGYVTFSGSIAAGGSGTVNETGAFGYWYYEGNNLGAFMLFHDILGSGVTFNAGNILLCSYSIAI